MSVADAAAMKIVTIEGLAGKPAEAVRAAWRELDVPALGSEVSKANTYPRRRDSLP